MAGHVSGTCRGCGQTNHAFLLSPRSALSARAKGLKRPLLVSPEFAAPRWLDRVDQGWHREYGKDPSSGKPEPVDEIWKREFYATIEDDQPALRTRDIIGEDTLMWGSDYPRTDSTWPCSVDVLGEMFDDYPPQTRDKITRTTVANLYGL